MSKELILWSAQICPFAHRARIALREKKLDVLIKEVDLFAKSAEWT
jgi:glutathione S-transferase